MYPSIVPMQRLGKHVPAAQKNCWRDGFLCGPFHIKVKQAISSYQIYFYYYSTSVLTQKKVDGVENVAHAV
jgi:hypothetical protein